LQGAAGMSSSSLVGIPVFCEAALETPSFTGTESSLLLGSLNERLDSGRSSPFNQVQFLVLYPVPYRELPEVQPLERGLIKGHQATVSAEYVPGILISEQLCDRSSRFHFRLLSHPADSRLAPQINRLFLEARTSSLHSSLANRIGGRENRSYPAHSAFGPSPSTQPVSAIRSIGNRHTSTASLPSQPS